MNTGTAAPQRQHNDGQTRRRQRLDRVIGPATAHRIAVAKSHLMAAARNASSASGRRMKAQMAEYRGRHVGERCVIIGNGPSLNETDLSLLKSETTFGLNRIYLMQDRLGFLPTYHAVVNTLVVEQCAAELASVGRPLFSTAPNRELLADAPRAIFLNQLEGPSFSTDASHGVWEGTTVTYVALQLAYYMGFETVVLVGVDHNFTTTGPANKAIVSDGADPNHFDPNYFGRGFRWHLPDLETSEIAYGLARQAFEADGRRVIDATTGGRLTVFPKADLAAALR